MIANAPGTVMDISREETRALAFSIWSIGPMNGPITGPLIGGFAAQYLGWRWTNWIVMILGGVAWISTSAITETYAPAILQKMAAERRRETGDDRWWCRYDVKMSISRSLRINLSRPFVLTATEPILWFWDLYIAVVYGILYLCFVAYPIIFSQHRGWGPGFTGLAFSGIGVGTMITICTEPLQRRIINRHPKEPGTGKVAPEASVSMVCIAALLVPIGQLWFAWASYPITIHWIWSILAGVPFGMGNGLVFIYAGNYIAGSYGIYSASAMAGNSVVRSVIGGTLPLAGTVMFQKLGINWAGTMLGLLECLLIPIPFVFYKWGSKIRDRSPVIRKMREDQERIDKRAARRGEVREDVEKTALEVGLTQTVSRVN
jgi:MFS family permease